MMRAAVVVLLSLLVSLSLLSTSSAAVCGGAGYDLSSITFSDLVYNPGSSPLGAGYTWYFHPCNNVTYSGCQNLETTTPGGVMMCQIPLSGGNGYAISTWVPENSQASTTWTPIRPTNGPQSGGVQMYLQDGAVCGSTPRTLTVNFMCSPQLAAGIAQFTSINETVTCNYVATVMTSAACGPGNANTNGQVACGTQGLNLNSLTSTDLIYKDTTRNYTYYFRPCGVVTSPQCANNPYGNVAGEAMMCQAAGLYGELSPYTYDIAWWNPQLASWRRFNVPQGNGWVMTIADGTTCAGAGNGISRTLTVYWICAPTYTTPVFTLLNETSTCNYAAYILTSVACNNTQLVNTQIGGSCGGAYDLTFATQRDLIYQTPGSTQYIVFRPCGVVDNAVCQANGNTNQSMMCQAYQGSTSTYDIAIYNPTAVTYTPTLTGIQMFIQDGDYCGSAQRSLTANFVCGGGPPNSIQFTNFQELQTCQYTATLTTPAVCRQGRQNGICGSQNYDFSLSGSNDYAWPSTDGSYVYYFNPCGQVRNAQCNASPSTASSMMCQAAVGSQSTYDIAFYDSQLVNWLKLSNGMQMFVQDGQSCNINGVVYDRALTVNFICGATAVFNNLTESSTTPCNYFATITTPQACNPITPGSATGISIAAASTGAVAYESISQCGGPYNLLPLSQYDMTYYPPNQEYKWTLRVCGAVTSDANCTAAAAAAQVAGGYMLCQDSQYGYGAYEASTYNQYTAYWTPSNRWNGVIMTMADGASCGGTPRTTRIFFSCLASATTAYIYNITENPQCFYNVYVYTNLVCATAGTQCGGAGYDLTPLTTRGDLAALNQGGWNWYFSPCGTVQNSQCQLASNALTQGSMVCQASTNSNSTYSVASWAPQFTTWTALPGGGVSMTVQDGSTCDGHDFERVFTANFLCGQGGGYQMNISEVTICNYVATINTGLACNQIQTSSSSGLSGGAIAGIVIGSVVGALIILGVVLVLCCGAARRSGKSSKDTSYGSEGGSSPRGAGKFSDLEPSQSGVEMETDRA